MIALTMSTKPTSSAPLASPAEASVGQRVGRHLLIWLVLTTSVAVLITLVGAVTHPTAKIASGFGVNWIYSLCIGGLIQALVESGRRAAVVGLRTRHPDNPAYAANWPGWRWMSVIVPVSVFVGYVVGASIADQITGFSHVADLFSGRVRSVAITATFSLLAAAGTTYYFYSVGRLRQAEAQAEAERRAAVENQLKLLESQLEPHMLFNTLANLRVLIALDPPQAQRMLDRLITFLRSTLGASHVREHSLATEFERIDDYLALMQVRMGARLKVHLDLPADLRELAVPSLLLQPVVENAIKHGLEPKVEGGEITVAASVTGDELWIRVSDTGLGLQHGLTGATGSVGAPSKGYGTGLVRQRLATLYGDKAQAELVPGREGVGAEVTIRLPRRPLTAVPAASA